MISKFIIFFFLKVITIALGNIQSDSDELMKTHENIETLIKSMITILLREVCSIIETAAADFYENAHANDYISENVDLLENAVSIYENTMQVSIISLIFLFLQKKNFFFSYKFNINVLLFYLNIGYTATFKIGRHHGHRM